MKWVIAVTLPTGLKMAFSSHEEQFALVPISEQGTFRKASSWDSKREAEKYLALQLEVAPQLNKLAPFEFLQCQALN